MLPRWLDRLASLLNGLPLPFKDAALARYRATAASGPWLKHSSPLALSGLLLRSPLVGAYRHLAILGAFSMLGAALIWPIFGADYPPGVDTATFLHLNWVTKLAASGQLTNPFQDPYWYGGFSYLVSYPPLGYGLVGVISFVTRLDLIFVYLVVLVLSYGGIGAVTYWLAGELGLRRWAAALAAVLVALAYPVLSAIYLWGWFTSVMALPFALAALLMLERSLRSGKWTLAAWGGLAMALGILIHHMTGLSLGLGMVGWFIYHAISGVYPRQRVVKFSGLFMLVAAMLVIPWGIPFLIHVLGVGFQREIPGLWLPDMSIYRRHVVDASLMGEYIYPSYLWVTSLVLATGGTVYALMEHRRMAGIAILLLVLTWFSMGANLNPLIKVYPFSALDAARFHLFMAPFIALLGAWLVERVVSTLRELWPAVSRKLPPGHAQRLWYALIVVVLAAVLTFPVKDALTARGTMGPYRVEGSVQEAMAWLAQRPSPTDECPYDTKGRIYSVGLWNWDAFLVPYLADQPLIDGWHDEGASNVSLIRELRIMGWTGQVDIRRAHELLSELGAGHLLINRLSYYPAEASEVFWDEVEAHPEWFQKRGQWGDVAVFRILP